MCSLRVTPEWLKAVQDAWFTLDKGGFAWCSGEDVLSLAWSVCKLENVPPSTLPAVSAQLLNELAPNATASSERRGILSLGAFKKWCLSKNIGVEEVRSLFAETTQINAAREGGLGADLWTDAVKATVSNGPLALFLLTSCSSVRTHMCEGGRSENLAADILAQYHGGRLGGGGKDTVELCLAEYRKKLEAWRESVWGKAEESKSKGRVEAAVDAAYAELVTPIQPRTDASRHMMTVGTVVDSPQAKTKEGEAGGEAQVKLHPAVSVVTAVGDFGEEKGAYADVDAKEVHEKLMSCEWSTVFVNENSVKARAASPLEGIGGAGGEDEDKAVLERLVDTLLQSNDLSILDELRQLRGGEAGGMESPPPPPPPTEMPSPNTTMRRGSDLGSALRALTPNREKGGTKEEREAGIEEVLKLGMRFAKADGHHDIQESPILKGLTKDVGGSVLKL